MIAGVAAGVISTAAQVLLWLLFTDALPQILFRDVRLAAAIVMGPGVLEEDAVANAQVMIVASIVHFGLSAAYGLLLGALVARLDDRFALAAGAAFGVGLFVVNMYAFTVIFPWFAATRDWITAAAHLAFGVSAAAVYRRFARP